MAIKTKQEAQNPLILRCQRLIEAFAKSDDERDFYLDRKEGFILYVDLDKTQQDLANLEKELASDPDRYVMIPKLTFYETKKIMEGFVNEKVYDIDTKEKLLDIIQSKEARENFLEFIYDHHSELEKWQQFYQERSRIRIIEWLRVNHFHFVFEEDLEISKGLIEKVKKELFETKPSKEVASIRKTLFAKAKTYYSNEALNPRPKRGRPPKQAAKLEIEQQISTDMYTTVPAEIRMFLFIPDYTGTTTVLFSSKFESEEELLASKRAHAHSADSDLSIESLNQKLASLRSISNRWIETETKPKAGTTPYSSKVTDDFDADEEDEEDEEEDFDLPVKKSAAKPVNGHKTKVAPAKAIPQPTKKAQAIAPKAKPVSKPVAKATSKAKVPPKKNGLRSIVKPKSPPQKLKPKAAAPASKKKTAPLRSIIKPKGKPAPKAKIIPKKGAKLAPTPTKKPIQKIAPKKSGKR